MFKEETDLIEVTTLHGASGSGVQLQSEEVCDMYSKQQESPFYKMVTEFFAVFISLQTDMLKLKYHKDNNGFRIRIQEVDELKGF